jgi:Histidine kinase-, DNA gyrase B-, and HSP90-like ATPase
MAKSSKDGDFQIFDVTPDRRLLVDIGAANYTVPQAIAELVANCMDAKIYDEDDNATPIEIRISCEADRVAIIDNGHGMDRKILGEAMRLSALMDEVTQNKRTRKGMYGLGLKAACASLGLIWQITSRPDGDEYEYSVEIDLDEWLKNLDRTDWKIRVEKVLHNSKTSPLGELSHGTSIVVKKLRDTFTMPASITELLGMAYKPHLESGDKMFVNEFEVQAKQFDLVDGSRMEINLPVGDKFVTGWVGLDKKTHNDGSYGINIYREKQLVDAWNKDFIRAHLMSSRVVGEIELPFINANFHKNGLNKGSEDWKIVKAALREKLKPAVKAAGVMAKGKNDPMREARAIVGLQNAMGAIAANQPKIELKVEEFHTKAPNASPVEAGPLAVGTITNITFDQTSYKLSTRFEELSDPVTPWDYIFDDPTKDLQVIINTESRVYKYSEDLDLVCIFAISEVLIGFMMKYHGYSYEKAKEIRDSWLNSSMVARVKETANA